MHGEEEKSGCRLTDVVYIQVLGHGAGHGQLEQRSRDREKFRIINYSKQLRPDQHKCKTTRHNSIKIQIYGTFRFKSFHSVGIQI